MIVHSWDVANKVSQTADFGVCTIWGATRDDRCYLLHVFHDRVAFPDLVQSARALLLLHPPSHILIEDEANGTALLQEIQRAGVFAIELAPDLNPATRTALPPSITAPSDMRAIKCRQDHNPR